MELGRDFLPLVVRKRGRQSIVDSAEQRNKLLLVLFMFLCSDRTYDEIGASFHVSGRTIRRWICSILDDPNVELHSIDCLVKMVRLEVGLPPNRREIL